MADGFGIGRVGVNRLVARGGFEIVIAQLDANRFADISLALKVGGCLKNINFVVGNAIV